LGKLVSGQKFGSVDSGLILKSFSTDFALLKISLPTKYFLFGLLSRGWLVGSDRYELLNLDQFKNPDLMLLLRSGLSGKASVKAGSQALLYCFQQP